MYISSMEFISKENIKCNLTIDPRYGDRCVEYRSVGENQYK